MRDEINSLSTHDAEIRPETMKLNNGTEWGGAAGNASRLLLSSSTLNLWFRTFFSFMTPKKGLKKLIIASQNINYFKFKLNKINFFNAKY